jgi:hypothetical protein
MSILKPKICGWLFTTWHHLTTKSDMVKKHIGLPRAFEPEFQKQAMVYRQDTIVLEIDLEM